MAKYRVKPGMTYGAFGTFREGDIVELPENDAKPFLDKLDPVAEMAADVPDAPVELAMPVEVEAAPETPEADEDEPVADATDEEDAEGEDTPEPPADPDSKPAARPSRPARKTSK